ncbi:MAG: protoporphyrinogen oxidase [Cyanobacteria bacterium]|nr:protoporphyrinogen oxidase [Cyanobacteriota bacterium]
MNTSPSERIDCLIVGGGLCGLSAAYQLHKAGYSIRLIESSPQWGGVIRSHTIEGFQVEEGPNTFQSSAKELLALADELKLTPMKTHAVAKKRYLYLNQSLVGLPTHPLEFFSSPFLSPSGKWRLLQEWFQPCPEPSDDSKETGLKGKLSAETKPFPPEETVASFITRRFGKEVLDNLMGPFLSGIYAGDPENLSIQATFPRLYQWEQAHGGILKGLLNNALFPPKHPQNLKIKKRPYGLYSFEKGMQAFPQAIGNSLPSEVTRLNAKVVRLYPTEEKTFEVLTETGEEFQATTLILATPAPQTAALLQNFGTLEAQPFDTSPLKQVTYAPISVVHLGFPKANFPHTLDGFGCLVPRWAQLDVLGSIWTSSLFPNRCPQDQVLLTSFIGGALQPEVVTWPEDQLIETVVNNLQTVFGSKSPTASQATDSPLVPTFSKVFTWHQAIPQFTPGHLHRMDSLNQSLAGYPGLYLTGNYRQGVSLNDCVKQGQATAKTVSDFLKHQSL